MSTCASRSMVGFYCPTPNGSPVVCPAGKYCPDPKTNVARKLLSLRQLKAHGLSASSSWILLSFVQSNVRRSCSMHSWELLSSGNYDPPAMSERVLLPCAKRIRNK